MGAIRGSLTFSRFSVEGKVPRDYRGKFLQAARLRAFEPLRPEDEEQERSGWCALDRVFDLDLTAEKLHQGPYLTLGYRVDRWRIPASLLKGQIAEQSDKALAKSGREKLNKRELAEIKALVTARLRKKTEPTSKSIDVCWHLEAGVVRVWTHSKRLLEDFAALFEKTFGMKLVFESPYTAAQRAGLERAELEALKSVEPALLHAPRSATVRRKPAGEPDLVERIETTRFLGSEFLAWLWCTSELCNGRISAPAIGEVEIWLGRLIEFVSPLTPSERVSVRGVAPSTAKEAREALRQAKLPLKTRLFARSEDREFSWQLLAENMAVGAAAIPALLSKDSDEAFVERMQLVTDLEGIVHALYGAFLRLRLSRSWQERVLPTLHKWVLEERVDTAQYARLLMRGAPANNASAQKAAGQRRARP
ncbi:MAG TPA: hypothetical protein VK524_23040 [Polyangiaceae bacterium]|nr:hypothetical protein [Polyangiaceae bacterium]